MFLSNLYISFHPSADVLTPGRRRNVKSYARGRRHALPITQLLSKMPPRDFSRYLRYHICDHNYSMSITLAEMSLSVLKNFHKILISYK